MAFNAADPDFIITGILSTEEAEQAARDAAGTGRLVFACIGCLSAETKAQLATHRNVSHGYCPPCKRVWFAEIERTVPVVDVAPEELLYAVKKEGAYATDHPAAWRNQVAADLNALLCRAEWMLACDEPDELDAAFANAVLRITRRVAEFEQIRKAP